MLVRVDACSQEIEFITVHQSMLAQIDAVNLFTETRVSGAVPCTVKIFVIPVQGKHFELSFVFWLHSGYLLLEFYTYPAVCWMSEDGMVSGKSCLYKNGNTGQSAGDKQCEHHQPAPLALLGKVARADDGGIEKHTGTNQEYRCPPGCRQE